MRVVRALAVAVLLAVGLSASARAQVIANTTGTLPWQFPPSGIVAGTRHIVTIGAGSYATLDSVPTGNSGVIQDLMISDTQEDTLSILDLVITYRYDGRLTGAADDSFPLAGVMGYDCRWNKNADTTSTYETPFWARRIAWGSVSSPPGIQITDKFPRPYTNGLVIRLYALTGAHTVWCTVHKQVGLPACWNRSWRCHVAWVDSTMAGAISCPGNATRKVQFTSGGVGTAQHVALTSAYVGWAFVPSGDWNKELVIRTVTDTTHFTVCAQDTDAITVPNTFQNNPKIALPTRIFTRPAGKVGAILAQTFTLRPVGSSPTNSQLEAIPRFYGATPSGGTTGLAASVQGTGTEDWYGGVGYGFAGVSGGKGASGSLRLGVTSYDEELQGGFTAYRIYDLDPLWYTNGGSMTYTNLQNATYRVTCYTVYYERK